MAEDRKSRIKRKKLLQKNKKIIEDKEIRIREKLQHITRQKKSPIVNQKMSTLERNILVLEEYMLQYNSLIEHRANAKIGIKNIDKEEQI